MYAHYKPPKFRKVEKRKLETFITLQLKGTFVNSLVYSLQFFFLCTYMGFGVLFQQSYIQVRAGRGYLIYHENFLMLVKVLQKHLCVR